MITKYASLESAQVLGIKGSDTRLHTASLDKFSDFEDFRTEDGYLYARIRAISSRVNRNHDGWPSVELAGGRDVFDHHTASEGGFTVEADANAEYGYSTFLGKPVFVDHNNSDPSRARGVIVDAKLHVDDHKTSSLDSYYSSPDVDPEHIPGTWVELLLEVDAKSFPKLAKAIIEGSKDSKKGIDGFSMGCFVAGTPITLEDGTQKPIEEIRVADRVVTHTGQVEPVTALMRRQYEGITYEVETYGQATPMVLTEEHPVWTKDGWVEAKELGVGDYVLTPRFTATTTSPNRTTARLLGYYAAEGNLGYDRKRFPDGRPVFVEWNFNASTEKDLVQEIIDDLKNLGHIPAGPYIKNNCATVRCNNPDFAAYIQDLAGHHSWAKKFNHEVMTWDVDSQRELLLAYFKGDANRLTERRVEIGTASPDLAHQVFALSTRVGFRMSPPRQQHSPSAIKANKRPKYSMQATLVAPDPRTQTNFHLDDEGLWRRITGVKELHHDGPVYNFDVEGDDSYVAADIAVHNCDVERSVCSICKNAATSPDEYCKHVRLKGAHFDYIGNDGKKTSKRAYENCYGVKFFEISAVFDPADETALIREVRSSVEKEANRACPHCGTELWYGDTQTCPHCGWAPSSGQDELERAFAAPSVDHPLGPHTGAQLAHIAAATNDEVLRRVIAAQILQPSAGKARFIMQRLAENPLPQVDMTHAPPKLDTLRDETICPICGSTMDEETCDICGYTEPPEGFDNPDLEKARDTDIERVPDTDPNTPHDPHESPEEGQGPSTPNIGSPTNPQSFAHVTNAMTWEITAAQERPTDASPVSNEPEETIVRDHPTPVTSNVRTARDFIAAAGRTKENTRMEHTAEAASGAPSVAKPDVNVDVEGVGGVLDGSNEQASKADAQVDVLGIGGTGVEGVAADKTIGLPEASEGSDDAGFNTDKNIEAIPTKTFDDGSSGVERQEDPVTSEVFPESSEGVKQSAWVIEGHDDDVYPEDDGGLAGGNAVQGVQPIDPSFKAEERVNVLEHVTSPSNNSGPTKTWSGTEGNGVNRQQDPVTPESIATDGFGKGSSTHIFTAFKLADLEIELGLLDAEKKYARVAELQEQEPHQVTSALSYAQKVKTAGLSKPKARTAATRVPPLGRSASEVHEASAEEPEGFDGDFLLGA